MSQHRDEEKTLKPLTTCKAFLFMMIQIMQLMQISIQVDVFELRPNAILFLARSKIQRN